MRHRLYVIMVGVKRTASTSSITVTIMLMIESPRGKTQVHRHCDVDIWAKTRLVVGLWSHDMPCLSCWGDANLELTFLCQFVAQFADKLWVWRCWVVVGQLVQPWRIQSGIWAIFKDVVRMERKHMHIDEYDEKRRWKDSQRKTDSTNYCIERLKSFPRNHLLFSY